MFNKSIEKEFIHYGKDKLQFFNQEFIKKVSFDFVSQSQSSHTTYFCQYSTQITSKTYQKETTIKFRNCQRTIKEICTRVPKNIIKHDQKNNNLNATAQRQFKQYLEEVYNLKKKHEDFPKHIQNDTVKINLYTQIYICFRHYVSKHKQQINQQLKKILTQTNSQKSQSYIFLKPFHDFPSQSIRIMEKLKKFIVDLRQAIVQIQKIVKSFKICFIQSVDSWQQFHFKIYRNSFYVMNSGYIKYFTSNLKNNHKNCNKSHEREHIIVNQILQYLHALNLICQQEQYSPQLDIQNYKSDKSGSQTQISTQQQQRNKKKKKNKRKNKNKKNGQVILKVQEQKPITTGLSCGLSWDQSLKTQQKMIYELENMNIRQDRKELNLSDEDLKYFDKKILQYS